jgi:calcineurin-like phosphoesterase family protein
MPDGSIPQHNTRPFDTLDEMNSAIVNNINNVVMPGDSLFFLGDWSFGGFENIKKFYDRLSCKNICFIYGNHDHHVKNKEETQRLFVSVDHYKILIVDKIKFVLMHYPISSWDGLDNGFMHLHGHMHFTGENRFGKGRRMDVGMDGHPEFRPYNLMEEVVPILTKRPIVSEFSNDHHLDGL